MRKAYNREGDDLVGEGVVEDGLILGKAVEDATERVAPEEGGGRPTQWLEHPGVESASQVETKAKHS